MPSPNRSKVRPNGPYEEIDVAAEVDGLEVEGVVVVALDVALAGSDGDSVASSHSGSLTTNVASGNDEIAEAWSPWRWVITTTSMSLGARPRSRSWEAASWPGSSSW